MSGIDANFGLLAEPPHDATHSAAFTGDRDTRPIPKIVTPQAAALEALDHAREAAMFTHAAVERLERIFDAIETTPELRQIALAGTGPLVVVDRCHWESKSIGVLNPNAVSVCLGIGGSASFAGRTPVVPPNSMMTLPVHAYDLEIGVDPSQVATLAGGTAIVHLFRFYAVQPFYCARIA